MSAKRQAAGRKAQAAGTAWENSIEGINRDYATANTALVDRLRQSGRFAKGKGFVATKSPVDFNGAVKVGDRFVPVRFDAKEFSGDRWTFSDWKPGAKKHHQLQSLRAMARFGGVAFALVRRTGIFNRDNRGSVVFYDYPAWLVTLAVIEGAIEVNHWSLNVGDLDKLAVTVRGADWLEALYNLPGLAQ